MMPNQAIAMNHLSLMGQTPFPQHIPLSAGQSVEQYPSSSLFGEEVVRSIVNQSVSPGMGHYSSTMVDAPVFSDFFEWDLALLWNYD
jgi:hypothetical protein